MLAERTWISPSKGRQTPNFSAEGDLNLTGDKVAVITPAFLDHTGSVRRVTPDVGCEPDRVVHDPKLQPILASTLSHLKAQSPLGSYE
jgi:hypothetical protein